MDKDEAVVAVESAMVRIRRRQSRRQLARAAGAADDPTQRVLDAVEGCAEPVGVTGLAELLGVDQPRASRMITAAIGAGLIRRAADQADGRRAHLVLTDAGHARLAEAHEFRRARFAAAMAGWSATERVVFADLLARFVDQLNAAE